MSDATLQQDLPAYRVERSSVHGNGVFAQRDIAPGERIVEYAGREITWDEAQVRAEEQGGPHNHTFFFSLANGNVIDGGDHGNEARFINHSCEPNCEAIEEEDGRIFIYALHDIKRDEELSYSYPLIYEGRHTPAIKRAFACRCGAPNCTGTMLAPKPRKRKPRPAPASLVDSVPAAAVVQSPQPVAAG
ncbi:SET domain-containing protein-lysine N-methyltransferase [Pseudoduganella sp. FT55W]|uniref:SET domain-containing protein-lysine N-methyltransferase n=1 Tax=Duganella rivi TaxID=2666083 RepID=A0A7X4GR28_9BURK|nr:SET domain-containing protein-lysine N-methyltransferase [Duganella rivi]MYM68098.1 SET domain-containing protein-lysine N-methyltransferase [Duganella rivi]